jgi:hypothetical protein
MTDLFDVQFSVNTIRVHRPDRTNGYSIQKVERLNNIQIHLIVAYIIMKRRPRHVTLTRRWPERYFSGLTKMFQRVREKELLRRRRVAKPRMAASDAVARTKKSRWTQQFHRVYPGLKFNKTAISARTGIPRTTLNTVYDRGLKAWKTGGSRPGANPQQWAIARLYKYVLVTKKKAPKEWYMTRFDPNANLRLKK